MASIPTTGPAATDQSAPHSSLRRIMARHPVTAFLVMAFAFAWTMLLPLLLSKHGFGVVPIELPVTFFQILASVVGLTLPAFLVAAATGGKAAVLDLLHRSLRWRVHVHWYFIALFGILVAVVVAAIPFFGMVSLQTVMRTWDLLFTVFLPGVLVPFLLTNLPEEIGWTSFQARLQERHGPVVASIMVAPAFALIHLPAYFVRGWISEERLALPMVLVIVGLSLVFAVFVRLLIMWLYNGTGGSLLIVALFHSAFNMSTGQKIIPELVLGVDPGVLNLFVWATAAVIAVLIGAFTRGRFAYNADEALRRE